MSVRYKYSGLTPELYQRLVSEHEALKKAHKKGSYKQFFQDVKQCSEVQARIIYQWSERLDNEIDRITLEYRTKGRVGREKPSVKRALYTALAMGL